MCMLLCFHVSCLYCMGVKFFSFLFFNFSTLSRVNDSHESKNFLSKGSVLNFLHNSLQETLFNVCHYFHDFLLDVKYVSSLR